MSTERKMTTHGWETKTFVRKNFSRDSGARQKRAGLTPQQSYRLEKRCYNRLAVLDDPSVFILPCNACDELPCLDFPFSPFVISLNHITFGSTLSLWEPLETQLVRIRDGLAAARIEHIDLHESGKNFMYDSEREQIFLIDFDLAVLDGVPASPELAKLRDAHRMKVDAAGGFVPFCTQVITNLFQWRLRK